MWKKYIEIWTTWKKCCKRKKKNRCNQSFRRARGRSKEYLLTYIERKIDARDARQTEVNLSQIQGNYIHNVSTTFKKGFIATTLRSQSSWFYFFILSTNLRSFHVIWQQLTTNVIWICRLQLPEACWYHHGDFENFFLFYPWFWNSLF